MPKVKGLGHVLSYLKPLYASYIFIRRVNCYFVTNSVIKSFYLFTRFVNRSILLNFFLKKKWYAHSII
jgi:hypothetical protein